MNRQFAYNCAATQSIQPSRATLANSSTNASHRRRMKIEDYAFLSDTQTGALVGKNTSVDWLCFPRFDSGACFAALLGKRENGRWIFTPPAELKATRRRYRDDT